MINRTEIKSNKINVNETPSLNKETIDHSAGRNNIAALKF